MDTNIIEKEEKETAEGFNQDVFISKTANFLAEFINNRITEPMIVWDEDRRNLANLATTSGILAEFNNNSKKLSLSEFFSIFENFFNDVVQYGKNAKSITCSYAGMCLNLRGTIFKVLEQNDGDDDDSVKNYTKYHEFANLSYKLIPILSLGWPKRTSIWSCPVPGYFSVLEKIHYWEDPEQEIMRIELAEYINGVTLPIIKDAILTLEQKHLMP